MNLNKFSGLVLECIIKSEDSEDWLCGWISNKKGYSAMIENTNWVTIKGETTDYSHVKKFLPDLEDFAGKNGLVFNHVIKKYDDGKTVYGYQIVEKNIQDKLKRAVEERFKDANYIDFLFIGNCIEFHMIPLKYGKNKPKVKKKIQKSLKLLNDLQKILEGKTY